MTSSPPITVERFRSLVVTAHLGGIGAAIAIFQSVLPYTYVSDCRANLGSREITELLAPIIAYFLLGIVIAVLPQLVACLQIGLRLCGIVLYPLWRRVSLRIGPGTAPWIASVRFRVETAAATLNRWCNRPIIAPYIASAEAIQAWAERNYANILNTISFVLFLTTSLALYSGVIADFSRARMIDQQRILTEACARAQGYTIDRKTINPWVNVSPYQPEVPKATEPAAWGDLSLPR
ncbi:hypothetical protein [Azospirillum himalayense]|uniref:Uncharacterized protein n=1 Tax=Azospirillum himalayense TaxID=654847 RepID=A0ABW0GJ75_9PROT